MYDSIWPYKTKFEKLGFEKGKNAALKELLAFMDHVPEKDQNWRAVRHYIEGKTTSEFIVVCPDCKSDFPLKNTVMKKTAND